MTHLIQISYITKLYTNLQLAEYVLRDPMLFGDYRNALDEEEIRYYEDLLDYEAVYFLFQEVSDILSSNTIGQVGKNKKLKRLAFETNFFEKI